MKSYSVLIGRFQPFHLGHKYCFEESLKISDETILVIGSVNQPRSEKNPWTADERRAMIEKSLTDKELKKTHFVFMNDFESNDDWVASMRETISKIVPGSSKITLVGHAHDASSFYLKLFPNWNLHLLDNQDEFPHATELRKSILAGRNDHIYYVDAEVAKILSKYKCQCDKYLDFVDRFETNKFKCLYCRECRTQINVSKNRNEGILSIFGESKGYRIRFLIEENKVDLFDLGVPDSEFGIKLSTSIDQIKINPFNLKEEISQLIEKLLTLSAFL